MNKQSILKSTLCLLMALVCNVMWAQPAVSDAPTEGLWAANTTWFQIKNQKNMVIRADVLTAEGYLALTNGTVTNGDAGLWCIVGNADDGYRFYNKAKGANVFLGMKNEGVGLAVFVDDKAEGYTTAFDIVASTDEGYWCMKDHGSTNSYWNQRDPRLGYWASDEAQKGDNGSSFDFNQVDLSKITGLATAEDITAAQALIKVAPGYPKTTTAQYHTLNVMVNSVGKGIVASELSTAVNNYKTCSDIILPEDGKAYTFTSVMGADVNATKYYMKYENGKKVTVSKTESDASVFVCKELSTTNANEKKYAFITTDGSILTWVGNDEGGAYKENNNIYGYSSHYAAEYNKLADWNEITIKKNGPNANDLGYLRLVGRRKSDVFSPIIANKNDRFDQASDGYWFDGTNSSAWLLTEVAHENTEAQNLALAEISATHEAISVIEANAVKLGENVGQTYYAINSVKVTDVAAVKTAIYNATTADAINAIKASYKFNIPTAGAPYYLYDETHKVYLDIHHLGAESNYPEVNQMATLSSEPQPLYITANPNDGSWKIHTTYKGGNYLCQYTGGKQTWDSWVSADAVDFNWEVELSIDGEDLCYLLKNTGSNKGYLGCGEHSNGKVLYANQTNDADKLKLKLVEAPANVLTINNLDAKGLTYPYALDKSQNEQIFGLENLTIAMDVTMGATTSNNEAFICASDISDTSDNDKYDNTSTFVAVGMQEGKVRYFASAKDKGWYTANSAQLTESHNHKIVIVLDKTNRTRKVYVDGVAASITNFQDFNHFKDNKNAGIFIGGGKNSVGNKYVFSGTVHSVQFFNTALTAERIAAIEYPATDKQESDALKALIAETQELVNSCYNYYHTEVALQTTDGNGDYYVSTNAQSTQEGSNGNIKDLIDNNNGTYFHSDYSGTNSTDGLDHHITIALGKKEINSSFKFKYVTRHNGQSHFPSIIKVYGGFQGAEDIEYEELTTINSGLPTSAGKEYISAAIDAKKQYSHLRFMVTKNSNNEAKGGHQFFHMAEFDLMPRQAEPVSNYPNSVVLPTTLGTTKAAIITAQEEANKTQTASEYATATKALQAAYDELVAAIASGNLPVFVSVDTNNPIVYLIRSKRGGTKVLAYDLGATDMVAVEDYVEGNVLQGWYFTLGSTPDQAFVHPYVGGGDVLAANNTGNSTNAVWAKAKGTYTYQEWTIPVVDSENGIYNIKSAGNNANYFSHNGGFGKTKYMGFWSNDNTTDTGSLFTFERISFDGGIWGHTLTEFVNKVCTEENVPATPQLGYITRNEGYNNAYNNAATIIAGKATEGELKAAYTTLRSEFEGLEIYKPEAGKFYRIKNNGGTGYLSSGTGTGRTQFVADIDNADSSIFYYTGSKLLSYENGMYLANGDNFLCYTETVGEAAGTIITFKDSPVEGKLLIEFNNGGRSFYSAGTGESNAAGAGQTGDSYRFAVEEVTSLPVVISNAQVNFNEATKCVSTLFTPVALEVPVGITAYIGVNEDNYLAMEPIEAEEGAEKAIIPANTGVILMADEAKTYEFSISAAAGTAIEPGANIITGTVAKTLITPEVGTTCYVLAAKNGNVGLYIASLNYYSDGNKVAQDAKDGTSFYNNAGKAYLPVVNDDADDDPAPEALAFRFGRGQDTTEIENVEPTANSQQPTAVYDLQGRRVLNPTKGIYIVNGKKVLF